MHPSIMKYDEIKIYDIMSFVVNREIKGVQAQIISQRNWSGWHGNHHLHQKVISSSGMYQFLFYLLLEGLWVGSSYWAKVT